MRVLVIPDIHLKPWIFQRASDLMKEEVADKAVCLMDIADDWNQQFNLALYAQTYDEAISFAQKYPDTLWCYGNHDVCYQWNERESGHSVLAGETVCRKLSNLRETLPDENQLAFIHRIDNVLFSHGGLAEVFVRQYIPEGQYDDIDGVIATVNGFGPEIMWHDISPIWYRPQYTSGRLYQADQLLQVVGHTPMEKIQKKDNLISCDVFSTYRNRKPIGTQEFLLLDTVSWEFRGIR